MLPQGSICTLTCFPSDEIRKFVFDGSEEFHEIPQAFFHYANFSSGGKRSVCDIQGVETQIDEDGGCGFILVDPVMVRTSAPAVSELVTLVGAAASNVRSSANSKS